MLGGMFNSISPMLTDFYQLTMAYTSWKAGRHMEPAVFEAFFRKAPFKGEYTIFAGIEECLNFVRNFKITKQDVDYLKAQLTYADDGFFQWLLSLDCTDIDIYGFVDGEIVFSREPLLRLEGPLALLQILETTLLTLLNYPTLIATNAARIKRVMGKKLLLEFGLRRAQGPNGGYIGGKYAVLGGADCTSNVLVGEKNGALIIGTLAHSFIQSFSCADDLKKVVMLNNINVLERALKYRKELGWEHTNLNELYAFLCYASVNPTKFSALVDTYDTIESGTKNYLIVSLVLDDLGFKSKGIRLDSGDLLELSKKARALFKEIAVKFSKPHFAEFKIVASNDLDEDKIYELESKGSEINIYGVGTNLITCQKQPALGMVYKLVEIKGVPTMKLSESTEKNSIPGKKEVVRAFDGLASYDVIQLVGEEFNEIFEINDLQKSIPLAQTRLSKLTVHLFGKGKILYNVPSISERKNILSEKMSFFRSDIFRRDNPVPYKVYCSKGVAMLTQSLIKNIKK